MCIIIVKPAGVSLPDKKTLENCFYNNNDGAGYMIADGERVLINKGFFSFEKFYKAIKRDCTVERSAVLHCRIGTQGGNVPQLCHPFPLSDSMSDMRKTRTSARVGVAHNGIIDLCSKGMKAKVDYSDTMEFITRFLIDIISDDIAEARANRLIERLTPYNRFALLDGGGRIVTIGEGWIEDCGGCLFSNESYLPPIPLKWYEEDCWDAVGWGVSDGNDGMPDECPLLTDYASFQACEGCNYVRECMAAGVI